MSCSNCQEGFVLPGEPTGTISQDFQGAYHAATPNSEKSKYAIILFTDGFGLPLKNCKIIADNLAKSLECDVWVPDYFDGRPLVAVDNLSTPDRAGKKMTNLDWIKLVLSSVPSLPAYIHSRPSAVDKRVTQFISLLKDKKHFEKFGAVGYCFGGSTAVRFAGTDLLHTAVICHPGPFSISEARAIRIPTAWVCAEEDVFWAHSKRLEVEAILAAKKDKEEFVEYEFKDYKGTAHGFAARPNLNLPEIKEAYEQAFEQTVEWFKKTLLA
ncbi:hypothetical protein GALMADRAFT_245735 [Galerina marginata CBS 339.88]|uniref:Dienelactone hydrolase domain-containing protein n=1 Tax=Galerina marginata (strain CBS 339.88) TaxID=685588 RepID=A0A067T329_GALM3|nr:hypothetical protein GALMADRAFT_245735 [Galerina marginata CBS 339.88]